MQRDPSALVLVSRSRSRFSYITNQDHRSQKQLAPASRELQLSFSFEAKYLPIFLTEERSWDARSFLMALWLEEFF